MKPNDKAIEAALNMFHIVSREVITDILTAAYAAQFQSKDYAGLVKELREECRDWLTADCVTKAADALDALLAERDALKAENESMRQSLPLWAHKQMAANSALIERLRAERDALKDLLPNQSHEGRAPIPTDWWSVAVLERRKRRAAEKERDALKAELAAANKRAANRLAVEAERDALLARLAPVDDEKLVEIVADAINDGSKNIARAAIAAIRPHIEAAERERCAKVAESHSYPMKTVAGTGYNNAAKEIAAAIRSGK